MCMRSLACKKYWNFVKMYPGNLFGVICRHTDLAFVNLQREILFFAAVGQLICVKDVTDKTGFYVDFT